MKAHVRQWIYHVSGSYWFVPALMAIAAIVLSQIGVQVDRIIGQRWMTDAWWSGMNEPEGARSLLATVAGSMITVAGVTFSLTILAVSYATSHFGPRLLDNFMHDRGNQWTLGTFVGTFLYCLLVLRSIRSGSLPIDGDIASEEFVPHLSILVAVAMTLASVGVLIFFIHHVPESIHISNVLERISRQLNVKIDQLYPESIGTGKCDPGVPDATRELTIANELSGYVQDIDESQLLSLAKSQDSWIRLVVQPGDYVLSGQAIAIIGFTGEHRGKEPDDSTSKDDDECRKLLRASLAIGVTRTPTQDLRFLINQLVEIAIRALSPGVNDPFTAMQCIDHLADAAVTLSTRSLPSRFRGDEDGVVRVITTKPTWDAVVQCSFGQLIPYVKSDSNVRAHLRMRLDQALEISTNRGLNDPLRQCRDELHDQ